MNVVFIDDEPIAGSTSFRPCDRCGGPTSLPTLCGICAAVMAAFDGRDPRLAAGDGCSTYGDLTVNWNGNGDDEPEEGPLYDDD